MRIKVNSNISIAPDKLVRRCGYAEIKDKKIGKVSYVRRLRGYRYPRFHIYIEKNSSRGEPGRTIALHLDQKAPIYQGVPAHSADYQGEVLEEEAKRILNIINKYKK